MISITVIHAGGFGEAFYTQAENEYKKRLGAFCNYKTIEVKELQTLKKQADEIIKRLPKRSLKIALCIEGKQYSSEGFARLISESAQNYSEITFIIGGSEGIYEGLKDKCDIKLSFSDMTFPHQMMRIILSEQVYRAFSIINNGKYHK